MRVIVTGASKGIGRGIATVLAAHGHAVGLLARSEDELRRLAAEMTGVYVAADLRSFDQTRTAIDSLIQQLGGVDALVNNAGIVIRRSTLDISLDDWHAMIETNINGVFYATRCVLPHLVKQGRGHIVNVSSVSGYMPLADGAGYAATKHAVTGFSESLMQEVRQQGVKVTTIFPGSVDTQSHRHDPTADHSWKVQPEEVGEAVAAALATRDQTLISRIEIRPAKPPARG